MILSGKVVPLASRYSSILVFKDAVVDGLTSSGSVAITTTSGLPLTVSGHDTWNYPLRITNTTASTNLDLKQGTGGASILTTSAVLTFQTASTERARFTATGLGIGTTSPSEKLSIAPDTDVSAEIGKAHVGYIGHSNYAGFSHVDTNTTSDYALLQSESGQTFLNAKSTSSGITFRIGNSEKMKLDNSGNVGIGTTSPIYLLSLSDSDGADLGFSNSSTLSDGDYLGRIVVVECDCSVIGCV